MTKKIGSPIIVEADNSLVVEKTCWEILAQMQKTGLDAGGFIIKKLKKLQDGKYNVTIQPIKVMGT